MAKLSTLIRMENIRMDATMTDRNPNMDLDDWPRTATHWRCTLKRGRRTMTTYFSQGSAICNEPTAADVLDCLAGDAGGIENASGFEDWASEYGYDTDSRRAERTYNVAMRQTEKLRQFMGDAYETLLWKTERL